MAVPKFFEFFPVVLQVLLDKSEKSVKQIRQEAISALHVSEEDCKELLPSGRQRTVDNRINWAITYLKNAKLIVPVRRGIYVISSEGEEAYNDAGMHLDLSYLERYESFRAFHGTSDDKTVGITDSEPLVEDTPLDTFEKAYSQINAALAEDLLAAVMEHSPDSLNNWLLIFCLKWVMEVPLTLPVLWLDKAEMKELMASFEKTSSVSATYTFRPNVGTLQA